MGKWICEGIIKRKEGEQLSSKPHVGKLGNWLFSWIQKDGSIHGFHNHSVWGGNPYRWSDFTSGHSTWASPLLASLSLIIEQTPETELKEKLMLMLRFQTGRFQEDGQYANIGFQMGETLKSGLIHNMMPNVSLGLTAWYSRSWLPSEDMESIRQSILRNMEVCDVMYPFGAPRMISNQEYTRLWGKLLFQKVFKDERFSKQVVEQLDYMLEHFHRKGWPDAQSEGTHRYLGDHTTAELAEYYGLIISPLILAYEMFGHERYLEHAGDLCRHLARSSWYDRNGKKRLHRTWMDTGSHWKKVNGPMLIAGMGMSLYGVHRYLQHREDQELNDFLYQCDETYAWYQNPRGYMASATGWQSEVDIAPSSAWHTHDWFYLLHRQGIQSTLAEELTVVNERISVLLGDQCMWVEAGEHWTITDYYWQDVFKLIGRKDEKVFGRDMDWVGGDKALPAHFSFPNRPIFIKTDEGIYLKPGLIEESQLDISSVAEVPYLGLWR
jgi:hypothetical protein